MSEADRMRRDRRRRRQHNVAGGRTVRREIKLTEAEDAQLVRLAARQGVTVPRVLVESALSGGGQEAAQRHELLQELFAAHRLLASISGNVNQIAKATNSTLEVQPETSATLAHVRATAERISAAVDELSRG